MTDTTHVLFATWSAAEISRLEARESELEAENGRLRDALADTLRMLEAAHRQLGMWSKDNPRIVKARAALEATKEA